MSGWIKWEKDVESDPRTLRLARELKRTGVTGACHPVTLACGGLSRLWSYADSHIREDDTLDMGCGELDELLGIPGFCAAMPEDWLREVDEKTVELPGFQAHNGVEARKQALTQKRVQLHRLRKRNAPALPDQTRPDQRRPDQKITDISAAAPRPTRRCPSDWSPTPELLATLSAECTGLDVTRELAKFKDHTFGTPRSDWPATFRNWVRTAQERSGTKKAYSAADRIAWTPTE